MTKNCVYCNKAVDEKGNRFILKVKNETLKQINMCSKECYKEMQNFIDKRDRLQPFMFIVLAILLVANLLLLSILPDTNYNYIALSLMGVVIAVFPYLHVRYRSYVNKGVVKTIFTLRILGILVSIMSLVFYVFA